MLSRLLCVVYALGGLVVLGDQYHPTIEAPYFYDLYSLFIYPGTKYCGPGNISTGFNDLGYNVVADTCCRDHDACQPYIPPSSSGFGLYNNSTLTTRESCACDNALYQCLKAGADKGDDVCKNIGFLYFTLSDPICFKQDYPIINCTEYYTSPETIRWRCKVYLQNHTAPKIYQWFDEPGF